MARRRTLLTYLAAYFFAIAVVFRGLNEYRGLPSQWRVIGLLATFALLFVIEPWLFRRSHLYTHLYLAVQTGNCKPPQNSSVSSTRLGVI